jgi:hypothetical protein
MFHYRWAFDPDVAKSASILPRWARTDAPEEILQKLSKQFAERQIGRLAVVGSNETTAPVIEAGYRRPSDSSPSSRSSTRPRWRSRSRRRRASTRGAT